MILKRISTKPSVASRILSQKTPRAAGDPRPLFGPKPRGHMADIPNPDATASTSAMATTTMATFTVGSTTFTVGSTTTTPDAHTMEEGDHPGDGDADTVAEDYTEGEEAAMDVKTTSDQYSILSLHSSHH